MTSGKDGAKFLHLSPHWLESVVRPKSQEPKGPRRCPGIGIKATIAKELVLAYPDISKVFEIYTEALSKQLGAVITLENRPIAFFSWKLSTMQRKCSVTKIELLAIVETLKEFKGMLWGQSIKVYTCDNIHSWISLSGDLAFSHQDGIYGFKFPKRFLEISSRDLTSSFLFSQS